MVDFALSDEQHAWREKAQRLATSFAARAREYDESGAFPAANFDTLREEGFLKLPVPREYGGLGTRASGYAFIPHLVLEEIALACPSTAWCLLTHFQYCGLVAGLGDDAQQSRVFSDVVNRGSLIGSLGSEVNPEQNKTPSQTTGNMAFRATLEPVDGGFVANGRKGFCSLAPVADYNIHWAVAPGTETLAEGLVLSLIPKDAPGLSFLPGWEEAMGIRASLSGGALLENVFIPWENVLGEPGDYVQKYPYTFDLCYVALLNGVARNAYDFVRKLVADRTFLQNDDTVMYAVGEMSSSLQACRTSWWYAQWLWDQGSWDEANHATLRALHEAKTAAIAVTTRAFEVVGVRGLFKFNPLERAWRDARTISLHTRESLFMSQLAGGELSGTKFVKEKYGPRLETRKTWADLGHPRQQDSAVA